LTDVLQNQSTLAVPPPKIQFPQSLPEIQPAVFQQSNVNAAKLPEGLHSSFCFPETILIADHNVLSKRKKGFIMVIVIF